jgi:hypothetical protein
MSRKLIYTVIGGVVLAVAAPLLTLALLHAGGGTAQAQPPASFTKVSVPDLGQHSTGWCWVAAAANSFWWYAYNVPGEEGLLGGGSAPYPWESTDINSQNPGDACWYDTNDLPQGYLGPLPIPGYRQVLSMIAQTTFRDANQDGIQQPAETSYCYSEGVEKWDYLIGLRDYVNNYSSGNLVVHDIIDPARCGVGTGMLPIPQNPPWATWNTRDPCGGDGIPGGIPGVNQVAGPPTFLDYQTELSGGQDVLLWMESTSLETAHVVTGVGYDTVANTITIADPWTHSTCPDHDDCWPLMALPSGLMPDHNNAPGHAVGPYDVCMVSNPAPLVINCGGTIWTVPDMIFVSPAGADIKVLTFYSEPEPPFEFVVSENNVINLVEDKHNNGPQDAWSDVSWWIDPVPDLDGDGIPDINVRWEAIPGDLCTQAGAAVACGEGDGPGTGGSGDGYPSLTGDNCQDGIDNDGDQLVDFADPDCLWELDDVHFQVWLPVSVPTQVNRSLKLHCKVPGDYTLTLSNYEWPVEMEDPEPSNNLITLDLPVTCLAAADKEVIDVEFQDPTGQPIPSNELEILKSQDYIISVTSLEYNNGPNQPTDAEISFYANVPAGCEGQWVLDPANWADILTVDGDPSIPSSGTTTTPGMVAGLRTVDLHFQTLEYGIDEPPQSTLAITRDFEFHCSEAAEVPYVFTFCNRADVKAPDVDPDPTNNLWCEDLYVTSLHNADIKSESWSAPSPVSGQVGVPFTIAVDEVKHNNGPQVADSSVTWTATAPAQVTAVWVDSGTSVLNFTTGAMDISVDLALTRNLQLTCNQAGGPYTVTLDTHESPIDPATGAPWVDPVPGNNDDSTTVDVNCTEGAQEIKWAQMPDGSPWGLDVGTLMPDLPLVLADDFLCTESGFITEIDFWASWYHDEPPMMDPNMVAFTLSLHSDVPAGGEPVWSHPGDLLWLHSFGPGECMVQPFGMGEEGWFDPSLPYYDPFADTQIWLYSCPIPPAYWFQQLEGTIYWLDIQATPMMPMNYFGWKTSIDHWNDDGVWSMGPEPVDPLSWAELRYPPGHPLEPQSIDLAFQIWNQACAPGVDTDGDGFNDDVECYLPTDPRDDCPDVIGGDDAWPLDVDMTRDVSVTGDVFNYVGRIGATPGDPMWWQRLDFDMDSSLSVTGDVFMYVGKIGATCT